MSAYDQCDRVAGPPPLGVRIGGLTGWIGEGPFGFVTEKMRADLAEQIRRGAVAKDAWLPYQNQGATLNQGAAPKAPTAREALQARVEKLRRDATDKERNAEALAQEAGRHRVEANDLVALMNGIPAILSPAAEAALFALVGDAEKHRIVLASEDGEED